MLEVGQDAPQIRGRDADGTRIEVDALDASLTLAIFFKTTCPTCQYAWQYYERLHKAYRGAGLRVLGISQHDADRTRAFQTEYDATFLHILDDTFFVSRAYDPSFVPTSFLIAPNGKIVDVVESWDSERMNELSERIAQALGLETQQIVRPQDNALASKIG